MNILRALLRIRWGLLRLGLAAFLVWALAADSAARLARLQLAALPDYDFPAEVARLRAEGRFGEAVMIADAGLAAGPPTQHDHVARERQLTIDEQDSWLRKARAFGFGALTGRGDSLEALAGAVTTDLFLIGDIRDLAIQGARYAVDGEADPVIASLSALGVVLTVAPEIDWAASLLKIGRKTGAVGRGVGDFIVSSVKNGEKTGLTTLLTDVRKLAGGSSPATALRALRAADSPADVAKLAAFVERNAAGNAGALALHVGGRESADLVKASSAAATQAADATRAAQAAQAAVTGERALIKAAAKGEPGVAFLRRSGRALLRPHPLVGLAKGVYKGNVEALAARLALHLDPQGWWLLPALASWMLVEVGLIWRRLARS